MYPFLYAPRPTVKAWLTNLELAGMWFFSAISLMISVRTRMQVGEGSMSAAFLLAWLMSMISFSRQLHEKLISSIT